MGTLTDSGFSLCEVACVVTLVEQHFQSGDTVPGAEAMIATGEEEVLFC